MEVVSRLLVLAVVVAFVVTGCGDARAPGAPAEGGGDVLAWTDGKLMRVDPVTLRRKGGALRVELEATALARDGRTLALTSSNQPLRLVDLRRMRFVGREIELGRNVFVDTMHWVDPRTIAAVTWGNPPRLLSIDVASRRVAARHDLTGIVFARAKTRDALVLLVGPADRIAAATLVVVDRAHGLRSVELREVDAGFAPVGDARSGDHRQVAPGLAVDPTGRRAVVVPPAGRVAEVDLGSLAVTYHELVRPASWLGRLRDWLEPAAYAKSLMGPERHAYWLGRGAIAIVALEQAGIGVKDGENRQLARARGVELIDATGWTVRTLSERAGGVAVAAETLLVYGGPFSAGASFSAQEGPAVTGLRAFTTDGKERFSLFTSRHVGSVEAAGRYAYAGRPGSGAIDVVDVTTGRIVRTVRTPAHVFILSRP